MLNSSRGISLIISLLGAIVLIIIGLFVYAEFFSPQGESENINFSEEGTLIFNNPGFEQGVWYLSYEKSGNPALYTKLYFDSNSDCGIACSDIFAGERVKIKGIDNGEEVMVRELRTISE